jgi:hypothetical protein
MRLTLETDPESVKRYRHVKPARGFGVRTCGVKLTGTARACTRARHHRGPHVAHGSLGKVLAVWDADTAAVSRPRARPTAGGARELREAEEPAGPLDLLRKVFARIDLSVEAVAFIILFIALVAFVIDWLLMIVG